MLDFDLELFRGRLNGIEGLSHLFPEHGVLFDEVLYDVHHVVVQRL